MRIVVVTQPEPLVGLEEAKTALGEDGPDRDALIKSLILAAQAYLDGPKGICGIAVAQQTVEVYHDNFDTDIYLPGVTIAAPLTSLSYLDTAGVSNLLDPAAYVLQQNGRLALAAGAAWPTVTDAGDGVVAIYDLGIEDADDPRIDLMKTAIIMHVKMTMDMDDPELYLRVIASLVAPLRAVGV